MTQGTPGRQVGLGSSGGMEGDGPAHPEGPPVSPVSVPPAVSLAEPPPSVGVDDPPRSIGDDRRIRHVHRRMGRGGGKTKAADHPGLEEAVRVRDDGPGAYGASLSTEGLLPGECDVAFEYPGSYEEIVAACNVQKSCEGDEFQWFIPETSSSWRVRDLIVN